MAQERKTLLSLLDELPRYGNRHAYEVMTGYRKYARSYRDLHTDILKAVHFLAANGIESGDHVVLQAPNGVEWVTLFLACMARGAVLVPIDYNFSSAFLTAICFSVSPKLVICPGENLRAGIPGQHIPIEEISERIRDYPADGDLINPVGPDATLEIVFTSGTTTTPRGVVLKHGNILANLVPIETVYCRWERLVWLIRPLRFASLLPLSHMFGQMLGVFVSLVMGATTIFTSPLGSPALARLLREERILVLFAVPRALSGLADHLRREMGRRKRLDSFERRFSTTAERHAWRRIWEFRDVHRMLGWRFWAMVVGGASTDRDVIEFWRRLGYAVIQGYGLTEAGPIVTVNNPFGPSVYSVGRAVGEQQIRIAADGEILVKGPNITPGYFQSPELTRDAFEDGWFRTGDIGEIDQHGYLHIKGRKKDVIVTDEGMNVFPEDIERVLDRHPLVKASVVVPMRQHNRTVLHAVLILRTTDADPRAILAEVNAGLEPHQKLASASIWPGLDFPRTPTQKIKRAEIQQRLNVQPFETGEMGAGRLEAIVSAIAEGGGAVPSEARLENDLGLSSLDRVEMACLLEDRFQISVSETLLRGDLTVGELKRLVEEVPESETRLPFPSWPRWWPVRMARCAALLILGFPILRLMCRIKTRNAADLCNVNPPVIFVSNHTSHLDTPAILRALPHRLRMRIAPAMTTRYFGAYLERKGYPLWQQVSVSLAVYLLYLLGNVYFLPPTAGFRSALRHTGRLVNRGFCPLVYPEGRISLTGRVEKFKPGIGLMVREMRVPVIPVFVDGLADILPPHARWPRKHGTGFVTFGSAITFGPEKPEEIAERLELEVRRLANLSA